MLPGQNNEGFLLETAFYTCMSIDVVANSAFSEEAISAFKRIQNLKHTRLSWLGIVAYGLGSVHAVAAYAADRPEIMLISPFFFICGLYGRKQADNVHNQTIEWYYDPNRFDA